MPYINLISVFLLTVLITQCLRPIAARVGLLDFPGGRKTHVTATPMVGGIAIFGALVIVSSLSPGTLEAFAAFLSMSAIILFMGVIDDAKELKPSLRMLGHSLVAIAMAIVADVQLHSLGELLYWGDIKLGILTIPVTVFATVGVINAINMADGIDGLSGGLTVVSMGFIAYMASSKGFTGTSEFLLLLICAIMAFLTLNFRRPFNRRALVYLGDAGSTMLGFMLAWLLIDSTQGQEPLFAPVYALWFMAVPLFDTVHLLIKRPLSGRSPFSPGTDHLHHALLARGYSSEMVVLLLLSASVLLGFIGIAGIYFGASESFMFHLFLGLFLVYFLLADRIKPSASNQSTT